MFNTKMLSYLAAAAVISTIIILVYAAVQQGYRTAANDPQLQIARDMSHAIRQNKSPGYFMKTDSVDLDQSLSVFTTEYDLNGKAIQSTGLLNGKLPSLPQGVFDYTKEHGEDVVSWQPQRGIRMALVVESVHANGIGFIAAGRSLLEVEKREKNLLTLCAIAWGICLTILLGHFIFSRNRNN
jgi:hypothetical protein